MFAVAFYKDDKGNEPVKVFLLDFFVLLHQFVKKSQKTPKKEIEQAKRNAKNV